MSWLAREPETEYCLDRGDVLGVWVDGILDDKSPIVHTRIPERDRRQPPRGDIASSVGYPFAVRPDGTLALPLVSPVTVRGLTVEGAEDAIRKAYLDARIIQPNRDKVFVSLQHKRLLQVVVFRRDLETPAGVNASLRVTNVGTDNGGTQVLGGGTTGAGFQIDLPAGENDLLHALALTGGFPGSNAAREILIYRKRSRQAQVATASQIPPRPLRSGLLRAAFYPPFTQDAPCLFGEIRAEADEKKVSETAFASPAQESAKLPEGSTLGTYGVVYAPTTVRPTQVDLPDGVPSGNYGVVYVVNPPRIEKPAELPIPGTEVSVEVPLPPQPPSAPETATPATVVSVAAADPSYPELPNPEDFPTQLPPPRPLKIQPAPAMSDLEDIVIRIPLRAPCGESVEFDPKDVILQPGDVIYVDSAPIETFYTGGLLPPGEYLLPQDYNLDVLEAVTRVRGPLINGAFSGSNLSGAFIANGIGGPSPRLLTVIRRYADGRQIPIRVDLFEALRNPRERLVLQHGDVLILQESKAQALARYLSQRMTFSAFWTVFTSSRTLGTTTAFVP